MASGAAAPPGKRTAFLLASHPQVEGVSRPAPVPASDEVAITIKVRVNLPSDWLALGASPNGVRALEEVELRLPATYPLHAPVVLLREDFDRSLAHVQPWTVDGRPVPCLVDGNLDELLHARGLLAIMDQLVAWLENAALGRLIDPQQGWEPVRRDSLADIVAMDTTYLRSLVDRAGGYAFVPLEYVRVSGRRPVILATLSRERVGLNASGAAEKFSWRDRTRYETGHSLAVFVWPARSPSGRPTVSSHYQPETVADFESLGLRAKEYGSEQALRSAIGWLDNCLNGYRSDRDVPLVIVLCARRPFRVIGTDSELEMLPYVTQFRPPGVKIAEENSQVHPAAQRHLLTPDLLRSMAPDFGSAKLPWTLLGCGSLGSKVAVHLARIGLAPSVLIDRSCLSPHNAARHALLPSSKATWTQPKVEALNEALEGLGQASTCHTADVIEVIRSRDDSRRLIPKRSWAVVNCTASLVVREALASTSTPIELPRAIEASIFAHGTAGLLSVEGPHRNPDTNDLVALAYESMNAHESVRKLLADSEGGIQQLEIGEGCGSPTMRLSDARVSMFAAPMAEALAALHRDGLPPDRGRLLLGRLAPDGMSLAWEAHDIRPSILVAPENGRGWKVRLSAQADAKISAEIRRWPGVETGGVLVGRYSEASHSFYIVNVLPAPDDSTRSPNEFVLGQSGVVAAIRRYFEESGESLYCLGTWHSHLRTSGPSPLDRETAGTIALARLAPSVLLISTPGGYRALLANAEHVSDSSAPKET